MIKTIKKQIKRLIPTRLWNALHDLRETHDGKKYRDNHTKIIERIRNKNNPLNVLFLVVYPSTWKYESLYRLMEKDPLFNPIILICPVVNRGREHMLQSIRDCKDKFVSNYNCIMAYDEECDTYLDPNSLNPDIVCYTNPYQGLIDDRYYIDKFPNSLTVYVNYGYGNVPYKWGVALPFHYCLWRYFVECGLNKDRVKYWSPFVAQNCVVTGYPMYDEFMQGGSSLKDWKQRIPI